MVKAIVFFLSNFALTPLMGVVNIANSRRAILIGKNKKAQIYFGVGCVLVALWLLNVILFFLDPAYAYDLYLAPFLE